VTTPASTAASAFAPTRWTLVLAARGESPVARAALGELCEAYYQPVFRFLRREGREDDAARELAQEFFARVLARDGFATADPQRGRFRSFLLGALRHFLGDVSAREQALKRGGGIIPEPLDAGTDTSPGLEVAGVEAGPPEAWFDREWALALMARALDTVEAEFRAAGREAHFAAFKPWLMGDGAAESQAEAARRTGLSEGAVKVAVHRLRKRFREVIRDEIAQTVPERGEVDGELRYLIEVLARARE